MGCEGVLLFSITSADASSPTVQVHNNKHNHHLQNVKFILPLLSLIIKGALHMEHSFEDKFMQPCEFFY